MKKNEMLKVLRLAQFMDVGDIDKTHLFDGRSAAINVWATQQNHPEGEWSAYLDQMTEGAFDKAAEYVGTITWSWDDEINFLEVYTDPQWLSEKIGIKSLDNMNQPKDIEWVKAQIKELFALAGVECPPIKEMRPY